MVNAFDKYSKESAIAFFAQGNGGEEDVRLIDGDWVSAFGECYPASADAAEDMLSCGPTAFGEWWAR